MTVVLEPCRRAGVNGESPWNMPLFLLSMRDLSWPSVWFSTRVVFHFFIFCSRKSINTGDILYMMRHFTCDPVMRHRVKGFLIIYPCCCETLFLCSDFFQYCLVNQQLVFAPITSFHFHPFCSSWRNALLSRCSYVLSVIIHVSIL